MAHRVPVSLETSRDPIIKSRAYELAGELMPDSFDDATLLLANPITEEIAPQLYAGIVSIEANIGEGYSRSSGKDRALKFEYALGSVRECMSWYKGSLPILGEEIVTKRRTKLEEIRRLLLATIPRERGKAMK